MTPQQPIIPEPEVIFRDDPCPRCKMVLPIASFYKIKNKNPGNRKDGLQSYCRTCSGQLSTLRRGRFIKLDRHGRKITRNTYNNVKKTHGLSPAEYDAIVDSADVCAICNRKFRGREPCIDHCHRTGKVRGLLCFTCNRVLGMMCEKVEILQRAIDYLKRHETTGKAS